ncbi:MAG: hypothetical protein FWD82_10560 [Defluviitaleaceae bacterium]|nr:hypothetical protein [Defluviitaleaceae bacterium]
MPFVIVIIIIIEIVLIVKGVSNNSSGNAGFVRPSRGRLFHSDTSYKGIHLCCSMLRF